jgi:transmembrane sensor
VKSRRAAAEQRSPERLRAFMSRIEFVAAAAAIILVAGVFVFRRPDASRQPAPEVAYQTGVGQRDSVTLDDGSVVHLGPASRIVVRDRDVTLTGNGYFRVAHDTSRPFVVHANGIQVRDIGTEFGVDADSGRPVRVVVREGVVALRNGTDSVVLNQGDVGVAPRDGRVQASRGTASADDVAWMQGRLVFRDASLEDVAEDLRRWYGVELRVTDNALLRRVFTGSFTSETADRVLEAIGLALGASVERRGDIAFVSLAPVK